MPLGRWRCAMGRWFAQAVAVERCRAWLTRELAMRCADQVTGSKTWGDPRQRLRAGTGPNHPHLAARWSAPARWALCGRPAHPSPATAHAAIARASDRAAAGSRGAQAGRPVSSLLIGRLRDLRRKKRTNQIAMPIEDDAGDAHRSPSVPNRSCHGSSSILFRSSDRDGIHVMDMAELIRLNVRAG